MDGEMVHAPEHKDTFRHHIVDEGKDQSPDKSEDKPGMIVIPLANDIR
jgi:hypothetical protein